MKNLQFVGKNFNNNFNIVIRYFNNFDNFNGKCAIFSKALNFIEFSVKFVQKFRKFYNSALQGGSVGGSPEASEFI